MEPNTDLALGRAYATLRGIKQFFDEQIIDPKHKRQQMHQWTKNIFEALCAAYYATTLNDSGVQEKTLIIITVYELLNFHRDLINEKRQAANSTWGQFRAYAWEQSLADKYVEALEAQIMTVHKLAGILLSDGTIFEEHFFDGIFQEGILKEAPPATTQIFELRMTVLGYKRFQQNEYAIQRASAGKAGAGAVVVNLAGAALLGPAGLVVTAVGTAAAAYKVNADNPDGREEFSTLHKAVQAPENPIYSIWRAHVRTILTSVQYNEMTCGFYEKKASRQPTMSC